MKFIHYIYIGVAFATFCSCATQKLQASTPMTATHKKTPADSQKMEFLNRVYENEVYQRNIVSKMNFTLNTGKNSVSVPGQLRMRKDEVIRVQLQVPLLGSEVGRLEFTPTEVLIVDRLHKQYVRASYDEVGFLADNGITFYTLQALFWNKLTLPGHELVNYGDLENYTVDTSNADATYAPITLRNGKLTYKWQAAQSTGLIHKAVVTYDSSDHGTSTLTWNYDGFKSFGSKQFPYSQTISIQTAATGKEKNVTAQFDLDGISTDDTWETTTKLSDKYTQVSVEEVLGKLISM